jgi:hypothetical protein
MSNYLGAYPLPLPTNTAEISITKRTGSRLRREKEREEPRRTSLIFEEEFENK